MQSGHGIAARRPRTRPAVASAVWTWIAGPAAIGASTGTDADRTSRGAFRIPIIAGLAAGRQVDAEAATRSVGGRDRQCPAELLFHERARDPEAETGATAGLLGREQLVEDARENVRRNTTRPIAHGDDDGLPGAVRRDRDAAFPDTA